MPCFTVTSMLRVDNFKVQSPLPTFCQLVECTADCESVKNVVPAEWSLKTYTCLTESLFITGKPACNMFFIRSDI